MTMTDDPPALAEPMRDQGLPPSAEASACASGHLGPRRRPLEPAVRAPMLLVFAVFSWSPIVQSVVMSFQKTNLITPQSGSASTTSSTC